MFYFYSGLSPRDEYHLWPFSSMHVPKRPIPKSNILPSIVYNFPHMNVRKLKLHVNLTAAATPDEFDNLLQNPFKTFKEI